MNHCLVFDIGKTNKKALVFDEQYRVVHELSVRLPETTDEEGYPCEDIQLLENWIIGTKEQLLQDTRFRIKAINCTAYGASFVHLDENMTPVGPLINYLKPFPEELLNEFLRKYGPADRLAVETASPLLGNLNSGLQLYWLKYHKPQIFNKIHRSLHLPQWVAMLLGGGAASEMTSIGCHTMLWNFRESRYHDWVRAEGIDVLFPPVLSDRAALSGLHDSSSALLPYLISIQEPFILLSTGTWCIALNPFNSEPLTPEEFASDCLCYLTPEGKPVKAARYFGGYEHEQSVNDITARHGISQEQLFQDENSPAHCEYELFMEELLEKQAVSLRLALGRTGVRTVYVDGGFSKNRLYMSGLARKFPEMSIIPAEVGQATALGAALSRHHVWNSGPVPDDLIQPGSCTTGQ